MSQQRFWEKNLKRLIGTDGKINHRLRDTKKNCGIVEKQRKPKKADKIKIGEKLQV